MMCNNKEEFYEYCKEWFATNEITPPTKVRDWKGDGVPPKSSAAVWRRLGISGRDVLLAVSGVKVKDCSKALADKDIRDLGFVELSRDAQSRTRLVVCQGCSETKSLNYSTFSRMAKAGLKFCQSCRGSGGTWLPTAPPQGFEVILEEPGSATVTLKCPEGHTIIRSRNYLRQADYLVCEECYPEIISGARIQIGDRLFSSKIESIIYQELVNLGLPFDMQVPYGDGSKKTCDFVVGGLWLEVTSRGNNLPRYSARKLEKEQLGAIFIHSVKELHEVLKVHDIVRPD